ncbi:hypothetical protein AK830_g9091 [Neonectria ditissima]|uniref:Uncharacterized protein n=1 Tax=Neonectria ditissima TaxID=78410 RepID=A0A0P7AVN5_9HYPO|nr:hypothetical protein AK830_g9091 [Neonectria ditissima]
MIYLGEMGQAQVPNNLPGSTTRLRSSSHCNHRYERASGWPLILAGHSPAWLTGALRAKSDSFCTRSNLPALKVKARGLCTQSCAPDTEEAISSPVSTHKVARSGSPIKARRRRRQGSRNYGTRKACLEESRLARRLTRTTPSCITGLDSGESPQRGSHGFQEAEHWITEPEEPGQAESFPMKPAEDLIVEKKPLTQAKEDPPGLENKEAINASLSEIQRKVSLMALTDQAEPGLNEEHCGSIEQKYSSGETLPVPDIELFDDSELDDENYWEWDQAKQQFRHWDEEDEEWVYFPENFD